MARHRISATADARARSRFEDRVRIMSMCNSLGSPLNMLSESRKLDENERFTSEKYDGEY
jgi:hypothetical protein